MSITAKKRMVSGYEITAFKKSSCELPHVRLHKMGSTEIGFMTPEEAQSLSDEIARGAAISRGDSDDDAAWTLRELPMQVIDLLKRLRGLRAELTQASITLPLVFDTIEQAIDAVVKLDEVR